MTNDNLIPGLSNLVERYETYSSENLEDNSTFCETTREGIPDMIGNTLLLIKYNLRQISEYPTISSELFSETFIIYEKLSVILDFLELEASSRKLISGCSGECQNGEKCRLSEVSQESLNVDILKKLELYDIFFESSNLK